MSNIRKFIDIGANLTDSMYSGVYNGSKKHEADMQSVLVRSWAAGLDKIIITGGSLDESEKALEIAQTDDRLYSTVGCHPTRCSEFDQCESPLSYLENMKNLIKRGKEKIVAIGECGLDYDRLQFCPQDVQKKYFEMQIKLCDTFHLPLFLHCRNAANDFYDIVSKYDVKGVIHSFDGTAEEADKFINLGFYIGINGCSLKTKENLETVATLPLDRILLETDCPWCEIRPSHAGYPLISKENQNTVSVKKEKWMPDLMVKSRNEPCNIRQILDVLASIKGTNAGELSEHIYNNTMKLFFSKEN